MRSLGSVIRGLRAIERPYCDPQPRWYIGFYRPIKYAVFWLEYWTPTWHRGRGPYFTLGLGIFRICRGY